MEKNRGTTAIAIMALVVAIVGLSVGFAAFSDTLTISSAATVTPDDDFDVAFSSSGTALATDAIKGTLSETKTGFTAADATIDNTEKKGATLTGLKANFTEPGQSVTYNFYVANNSADYIAYLSSVAFGIASGSSTKVCTAQTDTTQSLVDEACKGISIKVTINGANYDTTKTTGIDGNSIAKSGFVPASVTITYAADSAVADGAFDVAFGDITVTYQTVD